MNAVAEDTKLRDDRQEHCQDPRECRNVQVHVNNVAVTLQPGRYEVPTFKKVAGVPLADDLEELVNRKLTPVSDDGVIHIEGCEVFISHVKDGGAS